MEFRRKDKGCVSKVLAVIDGRVLLTAKWGKNNVNTLFVSEEYFLEKYGTKARA